MKTKQVIFILIASILSSLISVYIFSETQQTTSNNENASTVNQETPINYTKFSPSQPTSNIDFTNAAEKTIHAVVHVKTKSVQDKYYSGNSLFDFFFDDGNYNHSPQPQIGSGSGVIISNDGYIVTNNHVIENSDEIEVILNDKRSYSAKLVGTDPTTDIALLKIDENELSYVSYGNSDELRIGEWVLAVGNPFNLTSTVTAGIVSAKARNINILSRNFAIESFIQTDAAVNPGNSGGALVSNSGDLIGINTAIASRTGSYIGYSFAIPVNIVKKVVADIIEFGEVQRAYIGISIRDLDAVLAEEIGIDNIKGVYVTGLTNGGAAAEAGIEKGDVITQINDVEVNYMAELQEQVSKFRPGDHISITVNRDGKKKNLNVVLRNKHGNTKIVKTENVEIYGAKFKKISQTDKRKYRINSGVKITELSSGKLQEAGIKEGFIITSINKYEIENIDDIVSIFNNENGGIFIEGIYPNGMAAYYAFGK
ncbi:MAG: Do family serine endopeptidase [Bacteroidetes bacterium]|nr:Do family serine endopeptidase [Bacteroidota bacterium]MBT7141821.1 Do family serine endopeptidase [Bacteroidota bacterium]MBT7490688.1 Do family serine endopeptidase [Bacteroidota bacterium]